MKLLAFEGLWLAGDVSTEKGVQPDANLLVVVFDGGQPIERPNVYGQLLRQLSMKACFERFARLLFASGKLPHAWKVGIVAMPLADEDESISEDDSDHDIDLFPCSQGHRSSSINGERGQMRNWDKLMTRFAPDFSFS